MRGSKVTSVQVAKLAGVSQSAVSRVFTPGASASPKMAERVRKVAAKLGYRPNILARSLITGRSRIIGLLVGYLDNYFYPGVVEKLSHALQAKGYHVLVFMADNANEYVNNVFDEILDYQVDGVVMASVAISSGIATRCQEAGVPMVMFNRLQDDERFSTVTSDNAGAGQQVADFLVRGDHQRIGYVAGWQGASTQRDREARFRQGLAAHGVELFAHDVGAFNYERAQNAARNMFASADKPDALFVANDHMAFAVMDVLRSEFGLSVPGDVSVVGFDDVPPASWPAYNLTTIRQQSDVMVLSLIHI